IAKSGSVPQRQIVQHVAATLIYLVAGLTLAPRLLRRIARARWNILAAASPIGYLSVVLFFYVALAAALNVSTIFAAFLAGFAIATNARGGPGIVLASVAFDAGIINAIFYTTLVLMAVLTSQAAGAWLEFVLRRGWPLLSAQPAPATREPQPETARQLAA